MNQSMKILDMHCDTLIECWRHEDRALRDGKGHLNLKMMQEHGGMGQFFAIYLSRHEMESMDPYDLFKSIYKNYISEMQENKDICALLTVQRISAKMPRKGICLLS